MERRDGSENKMKGRESIKVTCSQCAQTFVLNVKRRRGRESFKRGKKTTSTKDRKREKNSECAKSICMTYAMHILVRQRIKYASYMADMVPLECQHFIHFLMS